MKVNVIIKGERRWDYKIRQRHNPSLAGDGGEHHITTRGRGRLCLGEKTVHLPGEQKLQGPEGERKTS